MSLIKYLDTTLTVDPGQPTGWAAWHGDPHPTTGILRSAQQRGHATTLGDRLCSLWLQFGALLKVLDKDINCVWIESVRNRPTLRGQMISQSGSLTSLSYLIGGYWNMCYRHNKDVKLVDPKWLGQLDEKKMVIRVEKTNGRIYRQHEADAVGMGLWAAGVL